MTLVVGVPSSNPTKNEKDLSFEAVADLGIIGFLRVPGCPRGWGVLGETLRIPGGKIGGNLRED